MSEPTKEITEAVVPGQAALVDVAAEILGSGVDQGGATASQPAGPLKLVTAERSTVPGPEEPVAEPTPARKESKVYYTVTWPEPISEKHRRIVEEIKQLPPTEWYGALDRIPCLGARHRQRGCQCREAKELRGEIGQLTIEETVDEGAFEAADAILAEFLDEELIGDLFTLPKQIAQVTLEMKSFPPKAIEAWNTSQKRLALYQKYGKRVADRYFKIPDFKHKELAALGVLIAIDYAQATHQTILAVRLQKAMNP